MDELVTCLEVTKANIWNFRQNNPELVIADARKYLGLDDQQIDILRNILLARGINKWLKVRRDLIAYKSLMKLDVKATLAAIVEAKANNKRRELDALRARLKVLESIRADLRKMCHSERYVLWPHSTSRRTLRKMNTIRVGVEIN